MAKQNLENGATFGVQRQKINENFTEVYDNIANIELIPGPKGDKGDTGEQGLQGIQGLPGEDGQDGAQGIQGEVGSKGDKGDQGIQGIQGETGDSGITTLTTIGTSGAATYNGATKTLNVPQYTGEVTLNGIQTLTNKTLAAPVITSPTGLTKTDVGLTNVDNTSDLNKPISTVQGNAIGTIGFDLLLGKKAVILADSFGVFNSIQYKFAAMGMIVLNNSISGTQITGGTSPGRGRIDAALALDPDIIFIGFGSNDWLNSTPLGTITSTDNTTYYGAWKEVIAKAVAKNPPCLVVPITLCPRGVRTDFATQEPYANAVVEVGRLYGVKVWDFFHEGGITYENLSVKTFDGVHAAGGYGLDEYSSQAASFLTKQWGFKFNRAPVVVYQKSFTNLTDWVTTGQTIVTDGGIQKVVFTQQGEIQKNLSTFLTQGDMVRITLTDVRCQAGKGHIFFSGVDRIFNAANGTKITFIAPYPSSGSATMYMGANSGGYVYIGGIIIERL